MARRSTGTAARRRRRRRQRTGGTRRGTAWRGSRRKVVAHRAHRNLLVPVYERLAREPPRWWGRAQPPGPRRRSAAAAAAQGARAPRTRSWGKSRTSRAPRSLPPPASSVRRGSSAPVHGVSGGGLPRAGRSAISEYRRAAGRIREAGRGGEHPRVPRREQRLRRRHRPDLVRLLSASANGGAARPDAHLLAPFSSRSAPPPSPLAPSRRERKDTARTGPAPQRLRGRRPRRARCSRCRAPRSPPRDALRRGGEHRRHARRRARAAQRHRAPVLAPAQPPAHLRVGTRRVIFRQRGQRHVRLRGDVQRARRARANGVRLFFFRFRFF